MGSWELRPSCTNEGHGRVPVSGLKERVIERNTVVSPFLPSSNLPLVPLMMVCQL